MVALAATALATGIAAAPAMSAPFGEIGSWGMVAPEPLSDEREPDEFFRPTAFGVDPVDRSVYVLDSNVAGDAYRLQKFDSAGVLKAATTIGRPLIKVGEGPETRPYLIGVAVDHDAERIYLLQAREGAHTGKTNLSAAEKLLVFSTDDLEAPEDLPGGELELPDPSASATSLVTPTSIAIDPSTGDALVLAFNDKTPTVLARAVVARFGASGEPKGRFVDDGSFSGPGTKLAGLVVAPDGENVYASKGGGVASAFSTVRIDADLDEAVAEKLEHIKIVGNHEPAINQPMESGTARGPQLGLSPDGDTLFFGEQDPGQGEEPDEFMVRGVSLADGSTRALFGGGAPGCAIATRAPAIVAEGGGSVFVLDHGHFGSGRGHRVIEFGPGGEGCPAPSLDFEVDGSTDETVTVRKGDPVDLDSSPSELGEAEPTEIAWSATGPEEFSEAVTGEPPAADFQRRFLKAGTYEVGLGMKLEGSAAFGEDWSAAPKEVVVESLPPTAAFTPSTASPVPGVPVSFDARASEDPLGGECTQESGCEPTNDLKTYSWDFGDGTEEETEEPTIQRAFDNETESPVERTVTLTVTNEEDVESDPVTRQITVQVEPSKPALTIDTAGTGTGTVTSEPAGIDCEPTCQAEFEQDEVVELSAEEGPNSTFAGWSSGTGDPGTCAGTVSPCEVTMSESKSLTATFTRITHDLTVSTDGTGEGTVTSSPAGIDCGAKCVKAFPQPTEVTLTADAAAGSTFAGWSGCDSAEGDTCEVTVSAAKAVGATFNVPAPSAVTRAEDAVTRTSASLVGTVDNNGAAGGTECTFEVALASDPAFSSPVATPGCTPTTIEGTGETTVFGTVGGLSAGTDYIYRVKATNAGGTVFGEPAEPFRTDPEPSDDPDSDDGDDRDSGADDSDQGDPAPDPPIGDPPVSCNRLQIQRSGRCVPNKRALLRVRRRKAIAKCRTIKAKRAKVRCLRRASRIGRRPNPAARCRKFRGRARVRCVRKVRRAAAKRHDAAERRARNRGADGSR